MATIYAINPKRKAKKRAPKQRRGRKKRASPAQLAARKKFAEMARARAAASRRAAKTSTRRVKVAAKRKRRKTARRSGGTMKSVHRKGGGSVSRSAWLSSGYRRNPKRRRRVTHRKTRRRASYRRNPGMPSVRGMVNTAFSTVKDSALVLVGSGIGSMATDKLPGDSTNPVVGLAKGVVVGVVLRVFGARFLGADNARLLAAGAVAPSTKNTVLHYVPGAAPYLGEGVMSMPMFPGSGVEAYPAIGSYSQMGSYSQNM